MLRDSFIDVFRGYSLESSDSVRHEYRVSISTLRLHLDSSIYFKNNVIFGIGYTINQRSILCLNHTQKCESLLDIWKCQSSPEYQFRNLSIRAQHPPVSEQNTRIPKMIQHKTKDIFVDQQNTNAAHYIRRDFRCG